MGRYRLIGGDSRRPFISWEEKVKAIQAVYCKGIPPRDVLGPIYKKLGRALPKNISIVIANWRKAIQEKLDCEDRQIVDICKQHGVIEEQGISTRKPRRN